MYIVAYSDTYSIHPEDSSNIIIARVENLYSARIIARDHGGAYVYETQDDGRAVKV